MSTQKIIITFLIVSLSLLFIISGTYQTSEKKSSLPPIDFISKENLLQEIVSSSGIISYVTTDVNSLKSEKNYVDNVNYIDKVYFSSNAYSKSISGNNITFFAKKGGLYVFDLSDISNNYMIQGDNFKVIMKSPGKIYLDTRTSNIQLFSFDGVFSVHLMDQTTQMTELVLFPKMFFGFNEARNKFLKNADLLRLETLTNIFYYSGEILDADKKIHQAFLKKMNIYSNSKTKDFFENISGLIFSDEQIEKYDLENIENRLIHQKTLGGGEYIQKYFLLFFNTEKKIAYYKYNIIKNLNLLFTHTQENNTLIKSEIIEDLDNLQVLDQKEYDNFMPILYYYYENLLKINSLDFVDKSILLSEVILKINGNEKDLFKSYFYLNKIYSLVNNKTFKNNDLQLYFLEFLKLFLSEKNILLNDKYTFVLKDTKLVGELDYLSLFMKNILIYDVTFSNTEKLSNVFHIFKLYNNINENINTMKDDAKSETILIENSSIIEKMLTEIRNSFFEKELNNKGLLLLKEDLRLSQTLVKNLDETMALFFKFYHAKKTKLSEKNYIYNSIYQKNQTQLEIYSLAIRNYSEYINKYDVFTKEIFDTKTIAEDVQEVELNKENLVKYLSTFEKVEVANIKFSIIGKQYYKISHIKINSEIFSFHLYPKEYNKITNIFKNGKKLNQTYELDNIQTERDDLYKDASDEEKDKYDFRKFFINLFFTTENNENKQFVYDDGEQLLENKNIILFKRDKLFGDRGEFTILKGYLDLQYNNVQVTENNTGYEINIKDTLLTTTIKQSDDSKSILGIINAQYVFNQNDHYFKNISIQFYDQERYKDGDMISLFDGKTFTINKNINIIDFKKEMDSIIQAYFTTN